MNTVEVRVARGAGDRAAAEIYFAGTLVDVSVATDIGANLLHGAWRLQADGGPRVAAWGQLPVGGSVTVTFAKGCWSRVAEVTVVADAFWLAEAEGDFRSVSVTAASGRVRGRLGRLS